MEVTTGHFTISLVLRRCLGFHGGEDGVRKYGGQGGWGKLWMALGWLCGGHGGWGEVFVVAAQGCLGVDLSFPRPIWFVYRSSLGDALKI